MNELAENSTEKQALGSSTLSFVHKLSMMEKELRICSFPSGTDTLPLKESLKKQFGSWGEINTSVPLGLMRFSVHLATRFYAHRLYSGTFSERRFSASVLGRKIGLRVVLGAKSRPGRVLLYLHGGGGVFANSSSYFSVLKNLAFFCGAAVVSVDYSRGPRHAFADALIDCERALNWCYQNPEALGGELRQLHVVGDSAGGTLAAALCAYCRDHDGPKIESQVLLNPLTSASVRTQSRRLFAQGYGLTQKRIDFFREKWFEHPVGASCPYRAPLSMGNHGDLPRALVVTSEYDPLRDEGEAYAQALFKAGTPVEAVRFLGMGHGMVVFGSDCDSARHMYQLVAGYLGS